MKARRLGVLAIIIFIGAVGLYLAASRSLKRSAKTDVNPTSTQANSGEARTAADPSQLATPQGSADQPPQPSMPGQYVEYSADKLARQVGRRVLFFHAPWCPQCRQLEASIKSGQIPSDVTIFKVDYDSNQKLRQQYGVTLQTTLVLLQNNSTNEARKYVAYGRPTLDAVIKNLL